VMNNQKKYSEQVCEKWDQLFKYHPFQHTQEFRTAEFIQSYPASTGKSIVFSWSSRS
jgi:hypothetical protein